MRHIMIFATVFTLSFGLTQYVLGEETKKVEPKDEMVCVTNAELDKIMVEKGYDILLTMKNEDGVVESVWAGGQSITITAAIPNQDKSCLLAIMSGVTYNPKAIEEVWETYKKQTKQKDI
jgi:hypothetical protein